MTKIKKPYNGNTRAKMIALKLYEGGEKRSREIQTKLIQLGYVEDISHVTCYRWVLEFEDYENQNKAQ